MREGCTSFPSTPLLFIVSSLLTALHYLNAWNRLSSQTSSPSVWKCLLQSANSPPWVPHFFSACGGMLWCRAKADRLKHRKFMNSPRSQFLVSSRNASLSEEHCVTKHKTAAKETVNRNFTTVEVEVFITFFA